MGSPNESVEQGTPRSGVAKNHAAETMVKIYSNIPKSNLAFILALAALVFAFSILVALPVQLVEALDGNLYVIRFNNEDVPAAIKRYNGTTGAFIDNFVILTGQGFESELTFGPDGNLYVINAATSEIRRYSGTTGEFMDDFVAAGSGELGNPTKMMFGPDGNLYVLNGFSDTPSIPGSGVSNVKRYDGTTGAFIDTFIATGSGGLGAANAFTFGPNGDLYISTNLSGGSSSDVRRYNGTTGAFIDTFVAEGSGGLGFVHELTFGPDGNLYLATAFDIKRYNGTTGAFIDDFVSEEGLFPIKMTFGPDANLYVLNGNSPYAINRYDGVSGAFIDEFIARSGVAESIVAGFAFAAPPPILQKQTVFINSIDLSGNPVNGLWSVVRTTGSYPTVVDTGFTPFSFAGNSGTEYDISVADYDGKIFQNWEDGITERTRSIVLPSGPDRNITLTAMYDTGDALRGFSTLIYTGTEQQPDLTVNAALLGNGDDKEEEEANSTPLQMWTVIDPQDLVNVNATATTYKVYATNGYGNVTFDHWGDSDSTNRIHTLTLDNETEITAYYRAAGTSPPIDGKIVFTSDRDGNNEIYVLSGKTQTRLTNSSASDDFAKLSPDGTKVAFESERDGNREIYVMNVDGSEQTNLSNSPAFDYGIAWSPDGTKIAFSGGSEIRVVDVGGNVVTNLTAGFDPSWSPDGTKIAFSSDRDGYSRVFIMNASDGSDVTRLTERPASSPPQFEGLPNWSPDGTKIALTIRHGPSSSPHGEILFTNGTFIGGGAPCCDTAWSPSGAQIAGTSCAVALCFGPPDVLIVNANGTGAASLTTDPAADMLPSWSPDGTRIAFVSDRDGNNELYVMNPADGAEGVQSRLTINTARDTNPDWRP